MVAQFERLGGVAADGRSGRSRSTHWGIAPPASSCASGWHGEFDAVASNADVMHSLCKALLSALAARPAGDARRWRGSASRPRCSSSISACRGTFPGIPHHSILFGPRYKAPADRHLRSRRAGEGFLALSPPPDRHRSVDLAPEGCSSFLCAGAGAAHGQAAGRLERRSGRSMPNRILDYLEATADPGPARAAGDQLPLHARRISRRDLNAHLGSAFSLEPLLTQSAFFRVHNRDDRDSRTCISPAPARILAPGIPGVVGSAKATAALMLDDLRRS